MNRLISASIHLADFAHLEDQMHTCEKAGVDWIHVDVMDGHFVPNITMGSFIVETCRKITTLPLDVHLMIEQPERHLQAFADAGAHLITVQAETCPHLYRTLQSIHELGCQAGVALNPSTSEEALRYVLNHTDLVLVMTVNPGFSGQSFLPDMIEKVKRVREMITAAGKPIYLQVDGGINSSTLPAVAQAGADVFVASSAIFRHPQGIMGGVESLRREI